MNLTIFTSGSAGDASNCVYPNKQVVTDEASFIAAVRKDHVCCEYEGSYRGVLNFISSNVVPMDIDNDHSDNPGDWVSFAELEDLFSDVSFMAAPSRNHMKAKGSKDARPRLHVYFPIDTCTDADKYAAMKKSLQKAYPFFDANCLDAGRFIFGANVSDVLINEGWLTVEDVISVDQDAFEDTPSISGSITEGSRNNTMSRFAGRVLKKYGNTEKAYEVFLQTADKCDPPLPEHELETIWKSALKFFDKVSSQSGYVPPEEYNADFSDMNLKPADYSDIGEAKVFTAEYGDELIYTAETDFLRFDGIVWLEDKQLSVAALIEFLDLQLADAKDQLKEATDTLLKSGVDEDAVRAGGKTLEKEISSDEQMQLLNNYLAALAYYKFVMKRRDMRYITSTLNVSKAMLNRSINDMDKDAYLLNTPGGTYDLKAGLAGVKEHDPKDLITKITECAPGETGEDIWESALDLFFSGNHELIDYVQNVVGMAAVGKVYQEHLIIAYGDGANGKSTFWNTIARVLGSYSGKISAEALAIGNKRNVKPEMAELKGKRLIIASEMEEGMRLNTATVKQLCSTDPIRAEKKFERPFDFIPTHTLVLYTNHLPRVGANDEGIWRRLVVIPFQAKITGKSDIKNYADDLFENAGPSIMSWIIEGARSAISKEFKWELPSIVEEAISEYRNQNDWFAQFVEDCCEVGDDFEEKSGAFYDEYRFYCQRVGEYTRNSADFYAAVEKAGFSRKRKTNGRYVIGLRLKSEFLEE